MRIVLNGVDKADGVIIRIDRGSVELDMSGLPFHEETIVHSGSIDRADKAEVSPGACAANC